MLLGKWLWETQVTAGELQGEEWAEVNVWGWCPWQEEAQEATSWTTGTSVVTWRDTLGHWDCAIPSHQIQMNCSRKLLHLWLLLKRWSLLSLWLLSPSTSLTLEHKSVSVLPVAPQQPPHCPASIHTALSSCSNLGCLPQDRGGSTELPGSVSTLVSFGWQRTEPHGCLKQGHQPCTPSSCHLKGKLWKTLHPETTAVSRSLEPFVPLFVPVTGGIHMRRATLFPKGEPQVWKPEVLRELKWAIENEYRFKITSP